MNKLNISLNFLVVKVVKEVKVVKVKCIVVLKNGYAETRLIFSS